MDVRECSRVALYARVSSKQQAEECTIDSQLAAITQRITADGFQREHVMSFVDDGYSGESLVRPGLEKLRDQISDGTVDRVYVHSPDRLARNYAYQVLLVDEWRRVGVEILFLNHDIGTSPEENLLLQVQGMIAEYERAKILERSRRGKRHKAQVGSVSVMSAAPYGYRYVPKRQEAGEAVYEVVDEQAQIVRQIFSWLAVDHCSLGEVCRRLQAKQIPSPTGKPLWARSTVWSIVRNPAYAGRARYAKTKRGPVRPRLRAPRGKPLQPRHGYSTYATQPQEQIEIAVPSIVDDELFEAVAELLARNKAHFRQRKQGVSHLLQGLLVCRQCGHAYVGTGKRSQSKPGKQHYSYYRCIGADPCRFGGERVCWNKTCRSDLLENAVWDEVGSLLKDPRRLQAEYERRCQGSPVDQNAQPHLKLIAKTNASISRLIDAYAEGLLKKEEFTPRLQQMKEKLAKLQAQAELIAQQQAQQQNLQALFTHLEEFCASVRNGLENADWAARREIIRTLVKEIEIGEESIRIVYKISPLAPFSALPSKESLDRPRGVCGFA